MKIENIQVLRGPNIWSASRKKLIQMRLNLEDMENRPTNTIEGFYDRMEKLPPLQGEAPPILPRKHLARTSGSLSSMDLGRGCLMSSARTIFNGSPMAWRPRHPC